MIPATYTDLLNLTRRQVKKAGVDLTDQDIFDALVRHEASVYGLDDYEHTQSIVARLTYRTKRIHTALVPHWIGEPIIVNPEVTETTPFLQDYRGNIVVPVRQDLRRGIWTVGEDHEELYIVGTYVDIFSAAIECLDLILDGSYDIVSTTGDLGSVELGAIVPHLERQRQRLLGKRNPMPVGGKG